MPKSRSLFHDDYGAQGKAIELLLRGHELLKKEQSDSFEMWLDGLKDEEHAKEQLEIAICDIELTNESTRVNKRKH